MMETASSPPAIPVRPAGVFLVSGIALTAFLFSVCLYYPGFISYDSAYQYWQVRHQHFSNHQPVLMGALWSLLDVLWPSPAVLLSFHFLLYWAGLALLSIEFWPGNLARTAFLLLTGFLPPAFLVMGHLWIDASLIATMTFGLALTVRGLVRCSIGSLVVAVPPLLYAGAVRHNALPALVPVAVLWGHAVWMAMAARRPSAGLGGGGGAAAALATSADAGARPRANAGAGPGANAGAGPGANAGAVAGLAALLVGMSFGTGKALDHWLVRERSPQFTLGVLWDLAGISVHANTMLIPDFARTSGLSLAGLRELYTPMTNVGLYAPKEHVRHGLGDEAYSVAELASIRTAWLRAISEHPGSYVRHRWEVTRKLFGPHDGELVGLFFEPQVIPYEDNPPAPADLWTVKTVFAEQIRVRRGWLVFVPAIYLVLAASVVAWAWPRRRNPWGEVALLTAASGLMLTLPLTIFAPSTDLRYSGWLFTASAIGFAACLAARGKPG